MKENQVTLRQCASTYLKGKKGLGIEPTRVIERKVEVRAKINEKLKAYPFERK